MYIERIKSKQKYYLYLRKYEASITYSLDKRVSIFRFGREENALVDMRAWLEDMSLVPVELQELNCTKEDIQRWINSVEERRSKLEISSKTSYYAFPHKI